MSAQLLTANRLDDGHVVYLAAAASWSPAIEDGRLIRDDAARAAAQAAGARAVADRLVVAPYLIAVAVAGERPSALGAREIIRAGRGPTITPPAGLTSVPQPTPAAAQ